MPNPRFLDLAKRLRNEDLPKERSVPVVAPPITNPNLPNNANQSFIFSYDGIHKDFFQELIRKSNERFSGTRAEIPAGTSGEVENMYILKRLALITTLYKDLQSSVFFPISPQQSEQLLQSGKLPDPSRYWEDLGLILYDESHDGYNPLEAKSLYDSLKNHQKELGLSKKDLGQKLIIVNAGLEKDNSMPHGVKPIVLPGFTRAYTHEVLGKVGEDSSFEGYGLNGGLPMVNQLGSGNRTLWMPDETEDIGLRVLIRYRYLYLYARDWDLVYSNADGRVNFTPQGTQKI